MKISILHLDLGIGGAEKLIVSIALALKQCYGVDNQSAHSVTIYTTHHDNAHCFEETLRKGLIIIYDVILFDVLLFIDQLGDNIIVYGDWLPRHLSFTKNENNSATALCAIMRMCYLGSIVCAQQLLARCGLIDNKYYRYLCSCYGCSYQIACVYSDVIIIDGVSTPIPLFAVCQIPTLFYCHYPDKVCMCVPCLCV